MTRRKDLSMIGPPRVYKQPVSLTPPEGGEIRRGAGRSVIEAAKHNVTVQDLAEKELGPGVRRGQEIFFVCRLHDDHSPSLRVNSEKDLWCCDPCGVGGDVVRLAELLWGYDRADVAAAEILLLFGHEVPQRPPAWFSRQERQRPVRDGLGRIRKDVLRRRLFRLLEPMVSGISDKEEREREARYVWEELTPLAARMVRDRGE
jgi:hypothetical protein